MFTAETYIQRREKLKKSIGSGIILLPGNQESSINFADNHYPFRQDSTFLYYFGIAKPGLAGWIDCDSGEEILFGENLTIDQIVWEGFQPTINDLAQRAGLILSEALSTLSQKITKTLGQGRKLHFLPPYKADQSTLLMGLTGWSLEQIQSQHSEALIKAVVAQRNMKSEEEIEEIRKAVNITGQMHTAAMMYTRPGMKEYEIAAKVQQTAVEQGGELAFPMIITRDGQTLHNHYRGNTIASGDMVLCDSGAETTMGYCGDMTRTFPVDKKFTSQQAELYNIVLNAHNKAVSALEPGKLFRDIHLLACTELFEGLKAVGLTKGDTAEAVAAGAHTMFFQCGLGHMMGLDVHDMENLGEQFVGYTPDMPKSKEFGLKSLRLGKALEPGFVLTVEPGIYIIPQLIDLWKKEKKHSNFLNYDMLEKYRDFGGIRVEEDFVIRDKGAELLGDKVAITVDEVEALRS